MRKVKHILVLVSGNGTNLQALIDAERQGGLGNGTIAAVISDKPGVLALERARNAGIPVFTLLPDKSLPKQERRLELSNRILAKALELKIDFIVCAGFLSILTGDIIAVYDSRMINIHPSLLPKFGGQGMYGERVHQAALDAGERESGCTVHFVDAGADTGQIILQRAVPVLFNDTPETLAERIHVQEHAAIVEAVRTVV
ncbi:MAG: phosphoribosylglycinamide formyltransferase [Treponema sp.]|jgi:phosphoribosylglycinamide formyltransferase-1|nr:phosphoribosylglycinamide formyltransferase [Treponema sp.]